MLIFPRLRHKMDNHILEEAIGSIWDTLDNEPDKCMGQTKLAGPDEINWAANFKDKLGPFQEFLNSHSDLFIIDSSRGVGRNIVYLVQQGNRVPPAPAQAFGAPAPLQPAARGFNRQNYSAWRPFDLRDGFDDNKLTKLSYHRESLWTKYFQPRIPVSPLHLRPEALNPASVENARSIFTEAYNKCSRLTISIGYVLSHQDVTQSLVQGLLQQYLPTNTTSRAIVQLREISTSAFVEATVTVWGMGENSPFQDLERLIQAFNQRRILLFGKTLTAYQVGYGPCPRALVEGIKELLQMRRTAAQDSAAAVAPPSPLAHPLPALLPNPGAGAGGPAAGQPPAHGPAQGQGQSQGQGAGFGGAGPPPFRPPQPPVPAPVIKPLPPARRLWPVEYNLEDASKRIHDPNEFTALGDFVRIAAADLQAKERLLRAQCAEQRALPENQRRKYDCANNVEWIAEEEFFLGRGADAAVFLGLYQDPSRPSGAPSILVAVKQGFDGKNPLNEKEQEHLLSLQGQPGIVRYYTGFEAHYRTTSYFVLVQDVGICCLRRLISGTVATPPPHPGHQPARQPVAAVAGAQAPMSPQDFRNGVALTAEQKFKLTKALCMAVKDLHFVCGLMHRDIRPENVLLMADGKVCLSDFGMARQVQMHGHSVFSAMRRSTMQAYEVQCLYQDDANPPQKVPIKHSGDVFMLGCVIAYINQGREPFTQNSQIYPDRALPDIDESIRREQPWLCDLLLCMLDHDHRKRPTLEFVLRHPYFTTHSKNLEILRRMESTVVADYKPIDDTYFQTLEGLLAPLEKKLAEDVVKWHDRLPEEVFALCGCDSSTVRFVREEGAPLPRAHPLPRLAQLLRWIRNVLSHWEGHARRIQDLLRRTKADGAADTDVGAGVGAGGGAIVKNAKCAAAGAGAVANGEEEPFYETAGEFFMKHSAVNWLLPLFWKAKAMRVAEVTKDRQKLIWENEQHQQAFNVTKAALEDLRTTIDALLE